MTALETDDLAVVTGPLIISGCTVEDSYIGLIPGEVVRVLTVDQPDERGQDALVIGLDSGFDNYIDVQSLTPMTEIQDDPQIEWGEVHDYVYEGDD